MRTKHVLLFCVLSQAGESQRVLTTESAVASRVSIWCPLSAMEATRRPDIFFPTASWSSSSTTSRLVIKCTWDRPTQCTTVRQALEIAQTQILEETHGDQTLFAPKSCIFTSDMYSFPWPPTRQVVDFSYQTPSYSRHASHMCIQSSLCL